jgi:hypothetical protein
MKADYTFRTAINMVNWLGEEWAAHKHTCEQCTHGELDDDLCEQGTTMYLNRVRWHRRVRYAARREGVKMTFSRLSYS